ncbi:MOSC domain-containing protein [Acetobacter cibinongensis]|uniref:MOSC domain-containing protein n=1 Tax=Acetobacter cibinongensis TaxID=146475 RepID=A0A0D6N0R1_9PROT|nr:MOSC N-terminal beta barrel domain-containing protein [Acetobacter cibinongensis]GAN59295.1 hypothetical protein Abci_003_058 [Acetobacter cibinongensis]GBQ13772.1 hypothetical protein AA0482_0709 [Acetobacter cibinongensis NRIC 0482]GEL59044.1 MOSC domain-containing protein [Acetobacter cibinongensis]
MPASHPAPTISTLHLYPVKALRGLNQSSLTLHPWGPEGDRRWMVVEPDGTFLTQRTLPAMARLTATPTRNGLELSTAGASPCSVPFPAPDTPSQPVRVWKDTVPAQDAGAEAAYWLSQHLGRPCRLVFMPTPAENRVRLIDAQPTPVSFADGYPLLVATEASLSDLNKKLADPVPMARFRPNIVVAGTQAWAEDSWKIIRAGTAVLRISAPCSRCTVTTTDQETGVIPNRKEPLATLAQFHRTPKGIMFAQNAVVVQAGTLKVGDSVDILETGASNLLPA